MNVTYEIIEKVESNRKLGEMRSIESCGGDTLREKDYFQMKNKEDCSTSILSALLQVLIQMT